MTAQKMPIERILHCVPSPASAEEALARHETELLDYPLKNNPLYDIHTQRVLLDDTKSLVDQLNTMPTDVEQKVPEAKLALKIAVEAMINDYKSGVYSDRNVLLLDDIFEGAFYYNEKVLRYKNNDCIKGNGKCRFSINVLKSLGVDEIPAINTKQEWDRFYSSFFCILESPDYKKLKERYIKEREELKERAIWEYPSLENTTPVFV